MHNSAFLIDFGQKTLYIQQSEKVNSMATIEQIRAARALLGWSQGELAERAGLSQTGIARIEGGTSQPNTATVVKIVNSFTGAGLEFIDGGVRMVKDRLVIFEGPDSVRQLQDDVYSVLRKSGGEVLLLGIDELTPEEGEDYNYTVSHIRRLQDAGASERILIRKGTSNFLAPRSWYRWIPEKYFSPHTIYVYGTKVALLLRAPHYRVLLLDNQYFSESLTAFFNFVWDQAEIVE